ncbi:SH2 domain-containing adapter protein D-like [Rhopilema esculentum]|uniref:SH2 domain-containing adapter protein D-like n=1 Tax=Rhopilema esculentum TaxID=499914 RepID=UPI0031D23A52|eukprot:gene6417-11858_t
MASGAGKGNFGSKFRNFIGVKKKPKQKDGSTGSVGSGESDDEGYMDPEGLFATEPPGQPKPPIPDYPPPFCPGSKYSPKVSRPYSSIEPNTTSSLNAAEMRDYARSLDNSKKKPKPTIPEKPKAMSRPGGDDYSDPWDTRTSNAASQRPAANQRVPQGDNYTNPYDSRGSHAPPHTQKPQPTSRENYIEPWDARSKPRDMKTKHKDDYTDPWDSKAPASLPKSSFEEDEDYTVPYDAGKPTPTMQGNAGIPPLAEMDDLYDVPYEEQMAAARAKVKVESEHQYVNGTMQTPKSPPPADDYDEPWEQKSKLLQALHKPPVQSTEQPRTQRPQHQSHAPSQKTAPPQQTVKDDYDAPWEWSNKSLTKAFANLPPPTAAQAARSMEKVGGSVTQHNRPMSMPPVQNQSSVELPPSNSPRVFEVDPTMPLQNQGWYHGKITRFDAEELLRNVPDCSYLIRDSESSKTDFSLSLKNNDEPMHLKIACREGRFILGQHSKPYDSIPEMVHHYSMNKLNIRGAEHVKLIYPVIQEAMYFTVEPGT